MYATGKFIADLKTAYKNEEMLDIKMKWPPNLARKAFNLALVENKDIRAGNICINDYVRMTITGKIDDILRMKTPIELENLFRIKGMEHRRKLVLVEGAPGSGKSTLAVHICQKWGKEELLQEFEIIILVQLRIPEIQQAKCIADLLQPMTKKAKEIEDELLTVNCRSVLFILDGWDELPPELREGSIFCQLIQPIKFNKTELSESAVIVTSRPIASDKIRPIITSRVEILGFKHTELTDYFTKCLNDDSAAAEDLLKRIETIPAMASTIHLPLTASILVNLHKQESKLPTTQFDIFVRLVCNHIFYHTKDERISTLASLDEIPEDISEAFKSICKLAYNGITENKIIFTLPTFNTLGLLQGFESVTINPKTDIHQSFAHLSIQEFLAAWYIAKTLSENEQVSIFKEHFSDTNYNHTLQFYAAITSLCSTDISEFIIKLAKQYGQWTANDEDKRQLLRIIRYLYEGQNRSLCALFITTLEGGLNLSNITLHMSDCVCIGYVLTNVADKEFILQLNNCKITDQGGQYLFDISKDAPIKQSSLNVNVCCNDILTQGISSLCDLLKANFIHTLNLGDNHGVSNEGIRSIADALECNKSLKRLYLFGCSVTTEGLKSIAVALAFNSTLELLDIGYNDLSSSESDDGFKKFANALQVNRGLKALRLSNCCMKNSDICVIANSLPSNTMLEVLVLYNYHYWDSVLFPNIISVGGADNLVECVCQNSTLSTLALPVEMKSKVEKMQKKINNSRREKGLPFIEVKVESKFKFMLHC